MKEVEIGGIFIERLDDRGVPVSYPAWRYHKFLEPKIVNNTDEDMVAQQHGWQDPRAPITAIQGFSNWYHDLEDMSNRQLAYYAKHEFDADLPAEAPKAKLLWAIWRIAAIRGQSKGKMVLLAQSIEMNYDETVKEIQRLAGGDIENCQEVTKEEFWL